MFELAVPSTAACDSLQIGLRHFLKAGLHLDFCFLLQRSKLVEVRKAQKERKTTPDRTFALPLQTDIHSY